MTKIECPNRDLLRQYSLGDCPDDLSDFVERHVVECPSCEDTIAQFDSASDTLMRHLPLAAAANRLFPFPTAGWIDVLRSQPLGDRPDHVSNASRATPDEPFDATTGMKLADGFANYDVLRVLGRGGMGVVFLARHRQLNRKVALKVVRPDALSSDLARRRFQREIQILGGLNHPGIVMATDAGIVGRGAYLVMEWIDGADFGHLVRDGGPLMIGAACEAARQIAEALAAAHGSGVVHRDVKPSNMMADAAGRVRLLDFGLAHMTRLMQESGDTSVGHLLGTLDYMAPEQADGEHQIDSRADLYALGAMLFFLLTGRPPHGSRAGRSILEHIRAVSRDEAPLVSSIRIDVPQELDQLIARLLSHDPANRPQTATEVASELSRWAGGDLTARVAELRRKSSAAFEESDQVSAARQSLADLLGDVIPESAVAESSRMPKGEAIASPVRRGRFWRWAMLIPLVAMAFAAVTIYLKTPDGTLKIESEVEGIAVELVDERDRVRELTVKSGNTETILSAGKYRIRFAGTHDGLQLDQDTITLRRGDETLARITRIKGEQAVAGPKPEPSTERLYQDRTESDWQRQFQSETEPVAKFASANALLSLAVTLPPKEQLERILEIGEEIARAGWGDRYLELSLVNTYPIMLIPRWQPTPKGCLEFQNKLHAMMEQLAPKDVASGLAHAILKGNDSQSALAAYILNNESYRPFGRDLAELKTIESDLDVPLTGLDRSAMCLVVRLSYSRGMSADRRGKLLVDVEHLATILHTAPQSRLRDSMEERLLFHAKSLHGPQWPRELEQSLARLVLRRVVHGQFIMTGFGAWGANNSGFTFNINQNAGGGGGGMTIGFERDAFDAYENARILELREANRHFLNAWVEVVNQYLEVSAGKAAESSLNQVIRTLDVVGHLYSDGDDWPMLKTGQLLTEILRPRYGEGPDDTTWESSDKAPFTLPATTLATIIRIIGRVPDFVHSGRPKSTAVVNKLELLRDKLDQCHRFQGNEDEAPNLVDNDLPGLLSEAPYETIALICKAGKPSSRLAPDLVSHADLFVALSSRRKVYGQNVPAFDLELLFAIFADLTGKQEDHDAAIASIIGDQRFRTGIRDHMKYLFGTKQKIRMIADQSLRTILERSKSIELTNAVRELLPNETQTPAIKPVPAVVPKASVSSPYIPDERVYRLYQGRTEMEWRRHFDWETEPIAKLEAAKALLSLAAMLPAMEKLERILDVGETIVRAGWDDRPLEFALDSTRNVPSWTAQWRLNTKEPIDAYAKFQTDLNEHVGRLHGEILATGLSRAALEGNDERSAFAISLLRFAAKSQIKSSKEAQEAIVTAFEIPLTGIDRSFLCRIVQLDYLGHATPDQRGHQFQTLREMAAALLQASPSRMNLLAGGKLLATAKAIHGPDWPANVSEDLAKLVLKRMVDPPVSRLPVEGGFSAASGGFAGNGPLADEERGKPQGSMRESCGHFLDAWVKVVNEYLEQNRDSQFRSENEFEAVIDRLDIVLQWYSNADQWPVENTSQLLTGILRSQYIAPEQSGPIGPKRLKPKTHFIILADIVLLTGEIPDFVLIGRLQGRIEPVYLARLTREIGEETPDEKLLTDDSLLQAPYKILQFLISAQVANEEFWFGKFVGRILGQRNTGFNTTTPSLAPLLGLAFLTDLSGKETASDEQIAKILRRQKGGEDTIRRRFGNLFQTSPQARSIAERLVKSLVAKSKSDELTKLALDLIPEGSQ